jgi:hypothetical protein
VRMMKMYEWWLGAIFRGRKMGETKFGQSFVKGK